MTKAELNRLARLTMSLGSFRVTPYGREYQFWCPVHRRVTDGELPHRFSVFQPYSRLSDDRLLLGDVAEHLRRHLGDMILNETPCDDARRAVK